MAPPHRGSPPVPTTARGDGARDSADAEAQELAWVRAIQGGDASALTPLLTRYQDRLFGVCVRMVHDRDLAADLTQDAMIKVIEGLGTYDGRAKLSTWMIRVTMNVCLSRLRAEKIRRHASLDTPTEHGPSAFGLEGRPGTLGGEPAELRPPERVEQDEVRRRVSAGLLRVAPEQRAILVLRDCRGLDYEQIAEVLSIPVGTVKSRLFRARGALREVLEECGSDERGTDQTGVDRTGTDRTGVDRPASRRAPDSAV